MGLLDAGSGLSESRHRAIEMPHFVTLPGLELAAFKSKNSCYLNEEKRQFIRESNISERGPETQIPGAANATML